jgi:V8-like Glu-specific endopeptidase
MSKTHVRLAIVNRKHFRALLAVTAVGLFWAGEASAQVKRVGNFTVYTAPASSTQTTSVDFVHAQPLPLPATTLTADQTQYLISSLMSPASLGTSGHVAGSMGTGAASPVFLGAPANVSPAGIGQQDFGTNNHPFSTAKADLNSGGVTATNTMYPYRAAGKLFFNINGAGYICSASLIKRGIAVTAAHCVANYGASQFYSGWQFVPGYRNGAAPYGTATVYQAWIKTAYYNGTDGCYQYGVICPDDVAILILNTNSAGGYVGSSTGWFGYGWNGFGFTQGQTHITQLGYPAGLDNAAFMERNDSSGFTNSTYSNNTIIGSNMNGGSSGGPWLVNFGIAPTLTGETNGSAPNPNIVVGVTSWGYISPSPKEQGAAPFTSNNVVSLVNSACAAMPAACQ